MMAVAMIPLSALTGSAVDMARLHVVKVRLQQACDAGVLAGRKFLTPSNDLLLDSVSEAQARNFFNNNFSGGWMDTSQVEFTPIKAGANAVSGTAKATVPMTIMRMFNSPSRRLTVTCRARFDIADADIMFVLDTTGSMACLDSDNEATCNDYVVNNTRQNADGSWSTIEKTNSRISKLRTAVANFYTTLKSNADPTTNFRFGFVPYSGTVNVGGLLDRDWLSTTTAQYQSRVQIEDIKVGAVSSTTATSTKAACVNTRTPSSGYLSASWTYDAVTATWTSATGQCKRDKQTWSASFRYISNNLPVADFIDGDTVTTPGFPAFGDGTPQPTSRWGGCIEERQTTPNVNPSKTSPPRDLDPDFEPNSESTRWRPYWPEIQYARRSSVSEDSRTMRHHSTRYLAGGERGVDWGYLLNDIACPRRAQLLRTMTEDEIKAYVAAGVMRPHGTTYHDIGMIWGTRLLSPSGLFAGTTAAHAGRAPPNRYIVFLTDGDMQPSLTTYGAYGMEQFDRRITAASADQTRQEGFHNARFTTACAIARERLGIRIFVISYAQALTPQLTSCGASPGRAFQANDATQLKNAFDEIAKQIAMLRIDA